MHAPEPLRFLTPTLARRIRAEFGTPVYVYDEATLRRHAADVLAFPHAFGLTARYAMKANPSAAILRLFHALGLHIDASSGHECRRALRAGLPAAHLSLSSQELPEDFADLVRLGVQVNVTSLRQLARYGEAFPGGRVGLRINPGVGSGGTNRTNVGGPGSSFGLWHEAIPEAQALAARHGVVIERVHTHIGSGSDPEVWKRVSELSIGLLRHFPAAHTLNLGGGFKVGRMTGEKSTDLADVGAPVVAAFQRFAAETGRRIRLEIEPGTYLVALAGAVLSTVQDIVSTGTAGHTFLRLDTGMTEVLRPSLYGAQHPLVLVPAAERPAAPPRPYLVAGHCCESGDILTPAPGDPEALHPRSLSPAEIGDLLVVEGAGAYCAGMPAKNYNSFPEAAEVWIDTVGTPRLIRRRQTLEQMLANELPE
jgi:diaminopimelate decarboxylase